MMPTCQGNKMHALRITMRLNVLLHSIACIEITNSPCSLKISISEWTCTTSDNLPRGTRNVKKCQESKACKNCLKCWCEAPVAQDRKSMYQMDCKMVY